MRKSDQPEKRPPSPSRGRAPGKSGARTDVGAAPCKRNTMRGRVVRRTIAATHVEEAVGTIEKGCEIFGATKGDWSLVDLIEYCLATTGQADVVICTWTAGGNDATFTHNLMTNGMVKSMRFIVDVSFPSCQPSYCAALRERFGDDAIRLTKCHAKFVVITNKQWHICIRTSMNLNENKRMETWEVSDSKPMAKWLLALADDLFDTQTAAATFSRTPSANAATFDEQWKGIGDAPRQSEQKKYFGDGPVDVDLRRVGVSRRGATTAATDAP